MSSFVYYVLRRQVESGRSVVSSTYLRAFTNNMTYLFTLNPNDVRLNGKDLLLRVHTRSRFGTAGMNQSSRILSHARKPV